MIEIYYEGNLSTRAVYETGEEIYTDAPKDNQGQGRHFSPTDLLAVALGSCILTLVGIMAKRLGVEFKDGKVTVTKEMAAAPLRRIAKIKIIFTSPHDYSPQIKAQLERAGEFCPVHQSLHPDIIQDINFQWDTK